MDPKLDDAFKKVIQAYFEGREGEESAKLNPDRRYTKKYLDKTEEKFLGVVHPKTKREKRKAEEAKKAAKKEKR